jgi:hypothetical protein
MTTVYFLRGLAHMSYAKKLYGCRPRVVKAPRTQCELRRLLGRAVAAQNGTQAGLKLDVMVPVVGFESPVDVVWAVGSSRDTHGEQ